MNLKMNVYKDVYHDMKLGTSSQCVECKTKEKNLQNPLPIWLIGNDFSDQNIRLLIVTKTAINDDSWTNKYKNIKKDEIFGYKDLSDTAIWLFKHKKTSPTIRRILKLIAVVHGEGEDKWERISWSNLIKCNSGSVQDKTTDNMSKQCLDNQGFMWKEIECLAPTHVLFLTGKSYDTNLIREFKNKKDTYEYLSLNVEKEETNMDFWEFKIHNKKNNNNMYCLRTWHPQNTLKGITDDIYVNSIYNWISSTQ